MNLPDKIDLLEGKEIPVVDVRNKSWFSSSQAVALALEIQSERCDPATFSPDYLYWVAKSLEDVLQ